MKKFYAENAKDTTLLVAYLVLHYLAVASSYCFVHLLYRDDIIRDKITVGLRPNNSSSNNSNVEEIQSKEDDESNHAWTFMVAVYGGFALGALVSGVASFCTCPGRMADFFRKLSVLAGLLGSCVMNQDYMSSHLVTWFVLSSIHLAWQTSCFIHILESVPGTWITFIGLGLFPAGRTTARLYSMFLTIVVAEWNRRLFLNSFALIVIIILHDVLQPKSYDSNISRETLKELISNPYGRRYFVCLVVLWTLHGYICYGIYHHICNDTVKAQMYACVTDVTSNFLGLILCVWTKQRRTVMSCLLMLCGICCFGLAAADYLEIPLAISTLTHLSSFLITCSWNILWLYSIEIIGRGARCLTLGIFSFVARLGSFAGALAVHHKTFMHFPAAVIGVLCLIGSLSAIFLLHETKNINRLPEKTRWPKRITSVLSIPTVGDSIGLRERPLQQRPTAP